MVLKDSYGWGGDKMKFMLSKFTTTEYNKIQVLVNSEVALYKMPQHVDPVMMVIYIAIFFIAIFSIYKWIFKKGRRK